MNGVPEVEAREERTAMELKGWTTHQPPIPPREAVRKEMWGGREGGVDDMELPGNVHLPKGFIGYCGRELFYVVVFT